MKKGSLANCWSHFDLTIGTQILVAMRPYCKEVVADLKELYNSEVLQSF